MQELQEIPLGLIEPNLSQPRRYFDEEALEALADSVRERGVLQPVLVRPLEDGKFQLVAGERRWRAARLAGLETIPALISEYDDLAALEAGLIENMAREDLNPIEEARACATLAEDLGLSHGQIAERVGRSRSAVSHLVRLLDLSEELLELIERGELSTAHGKALLMAKDPRVRRELARAVVEQGWTMRVLEARARESNNSAGYDSAPPAHDSGQSSEPPVHGSGLDEVATNIARVWGDAVGAEVMVRALPHRKLRVEFVFDSPAGALAVGGQLAEKIARASKRR
jgi:ParB family transcriptional regulator, chromosome partitioning protein